MDMLGRGLHTYHDVDIPSEATKRTLDDFHRTLASYDPCFFAVNGEFWSIYTPLWAWKLVAEADRGPAALNAAMYVSRARGMVREHLRNGETEIPVTILRAMLNVLHSEKFRRELVEMAMVPGLAHVTDTILVPFGLI
ncbi:hypothetical protein H9P43_000248 [Blastocladiella emersonii ATCC 22665]|nr:hypothetical protein H9P43_000248 [Blastocladiella emersonii ATCC 22665]